MNKIISFVLLCALLLMCFSGCTDPNDTNGDKVGDQEDTPFVEGELDKNSDLVVTLVAYLKQYGTMYDMISRVLFEKIDDIKSGIQPLLVAFDPNDYYFVCGYYNYSSYYRGDDYGNCEKYTWVGYKSESDVKEYYENTNKHQKKGDLLCFGLCLDFGRDVLRYGVYGPPSGGHIIGVTSQWHNVKN